MKIKAIIIEDESLARDLIKKFLADRKEIELVTECDNGFEGLKAIHQQQPDLVILDIQMPKISGFEMLELLDHHPIIIFSTAYNEFALKAFELNAVDYLLKPYSKERFNEAIDKAIVRYQSDKNEEKTIIDQLVDHVSDNRESYLERIVVKTGAKINVITIDKIIYLEAQDDYVMIYTSEKKYLKQKTMKFYEQHLDPDQFVRIHRSFIVKVNEINRLELMGKESYVVILNNGSRLKVSKTGYSKLKGVLNF